MQLTSFKHVGRAIKLLLGSLIITMALALTAHAATPLDFDGDGKTDYAVVRDNGSNWDWYILQSSNNTLLAQAWGVTPIPDALVPEDYDGDGKWDIAVARVVSSYIHFYILKSSTGYTTYDDVTWGNGSDDPYESQDFDGDGKADPTVVRNVNGDAVWYTKFTNSTQTTTFGLASDYKIRGDFDGDGTADIAVCRAASSSPYAYTFYVRHSSDSSVHSQTLGYSGDQIAEADFDGDGRTDYAVYHGTSGTTAGTWYWVLTSDINATVNSLSFGQDYNSDYAAPGDYDGDGTTDHAVRRRTGTYPGFYVKQSTNGSTTFQAWGNAGDNVLAKTVSTR